MEADSRQKNPENTIVIGFGGQTLKDNNLNLALNLSSSGNRLTSLFNAVDQTPTPTILIKNCEEVGLFEDLCHVNPFEETFRRAIEQTDKTSRDKDNQQHHLQQQQSKENHHINNINEDSLHTPQLFPASFIESKISAGENQKFSVTHTPLVLKDIKVGKRKHCKRLETTEKKPKKENATRSNVNQRPILPKPIDNLSEFKVPKPIILQVSSKDLKNAQLCQSPKKVTSPESTDPEYKERRRQIALRYRRNVKQQQTELQKQNDELIKENSELKNEIKKLKKELSAHANCNLTLIST